VTTAVTSFAAVLALGGLFATSNAAAPSPAPPDPSGLEVWIGNAGELGIPGPAGAERICLRQPDPPWQIAVDDASAWETTPSGALCAKAAGGSARRAQIRLERTK
jgi:hypothetical protein